MNRIVLILFCIGVLSQVIVAQSPYPGQHEGKIILPLQGEAKAYAFDLKNIHLLDSPFKQNMERESKWIMSLGTDRLLHSFRTSSGVYAELEGGYSSVKKLGGWEPLDCELHRHSTWCILSEV